ncbi:MAG: hypothetical protein AAFV19_24020 [Pseudomonadota bacterium]
MKRLASRLALFLSICVAAAFLGHAAQAADFNDPDWPCIQRKVVHLSTGQMWAGPPLAEDALTAWRRDDRVKALAPALAVRRTGMEEAEALIADFAAAAAEDRNASLGLLFAGAFSLIDRERAEIISGIARYARTQIDLTAKIDAEQKELTQLLAEDPPNYDRIEELEDAIAWDTRIYQDRTQSLTYVCETPVILEKRAFALARTIMGHLDTQ